MLRCVCYPGLISGDDSENEFGHECITTDNWQDCASAYFKFSNTTEDEMKKWDLKKRKYVTNYDYEYAERIYRHGQKVVDKHWQTHPKPNCKKTIRDKERELFTSM